MGERRRDREREDKKNKWSETRTKKRREKDERRIDRICMHYKKYAHNSFVVYFWFENNFFSQINVCGTIYNVIWWTSPYKTPNEKRKEENTRFPVRR